MFRGFPDRNNANLLALFGVSYRDHLVFQQSQGEKPLFAIVFARVLGRKGDASEYPLCVREIDAVLAKIEPPLGLVSDEHVAV